MTLIDAGFVPPSLSPRRATPGAVDERFRQAMRDAAPEPQPRHEREPVRGKEEHARDSDEPREDEERRTDETPTPPHALAMEHGSALLRWGGSMGTTADAATATTTDEAAVAADGDAADAGGRRNGKLGLASDGAAKPALSKAELAKADASDAKPTSKAPAPSTLEAASESSVGEGSAKRAATKAQAVAKLLQDAAPVTLQAQLGSLERAVRLSMPASAAPAPMRASGERLLELRGGEPRDVTAVSAAMAANRGQTVTATTTAAAVGATPKASAVDAWWPEMRVRLLNNGGDATIELELDNGRRVRLQLEVRDGTMSAHVAGADDARDPEARRLLEVVKSIATATGLETGSFTSGERQERAQEAPAARSGLGSVDPSEPATIPMPEQVVRSGLVDLIV